MPVPAIIQAIAERVDTYIPLGRMIVVTLTGSPMRSLTIHTVDTPDRSGIIEFQGYLNLLDFTDIWATAITTSLHDNVFDLSPVFLQLLGLETALRWQGFIRRKPVFTAHPRASDLQQQRPEIQFNPALTNACNGDPALMAHIHAITPRRIEIKLMHFLSYSDNAPHSRALDYDALLHYARNPDKIIWEIRVLASLLRSDRSLDSEKAARVLDLMDALAEKVVYSTRTLLMSISDEASSSNATV